MPSPIDPSAAAGPRFVGRALELGALAACLRAAEAGRGQLVAVAGEAGIGKTRLVQEWLARAGQPAERVLWGRCPEGAAVPAYWPWSQALRAFVEAAPARALRGALGSAAPQLARLAPEIRARLPDVPAPPPAEPEESRLRLFDAVASFLRRASADAPLVVVLDDLHWADDGTLRLLEFLAPELPRSRALIVATHRETELRDRPRALAALQRADERLGLRGLELADAAAIAHHHAEQALAPALVARLHRATGGNPYFLGELLRWLRNERRLADADFDGVLPDGVRELLRRRLAPLSDEQRRLLTIAAVIGESFELATLAAAAGLSSERALEELAGAESAGLVRASSATGARFDFAHALVRDTLYGDLSSHRRAELHRDVARALEALHAGAPERAPVDALARHYVGAVALGERAKAVEHSYAAGQRALAEASHEDAARHFARALEALGDEPGDSAWELPLRLAHADAIRWSGDLAGARERYVRVAERARAAGDARTLALAAVACSESYIFDPPGDDHRRLLEEALIGLGDGYEALRARVLSRLAFALWNVPEAYERRQALSREAVAVARGAGDPEALVAALHVRHMLLSGGGDLSERLAVSREAMRLAIEHGFGRRFDACAWLAADLFEQGDMEGVDRELERLAGIAAELRRPICDWSLTCFRAARAMVAGRFAEGERLADEALALVPAGPLSFPGLIHALFESWLRAERDQLAESEAPFAQLARGMPIPSHRAQLAQLLVDLGRRQEAAALYEPLVWHDLADLASDGIGYLPTLVSLARVALALGDAPRIDRLYERLAPFGERVMLPPMGAARVGAIGRTLGLLAAARGADDAAEDHFEGALALEARMGARPLLAWTQYEYARFLRKRAASRDAERAAQLRAEARATAGELGQIRLARLLGEEGGAAPAPIAQPAFGGAPVASLRREGEVWRVAFAGDSFVLRDSKGVRHLLMLLRHPGQELHALVLGAEAEGSADPRRLAAERLATGDPGDAGEHLDARARAAYRARLAALREELAEAERFSDPGRAERARAEIEALAAELSRAIGRGGRARRAGSAAERARLNVTRTLGAVLRRIAREHPALGEHLAATVRTGTYCSYAPDPRRPVRWELDP